MSVFHESCKVLTDAGILPQTVVDVARVTCCAAVLTAAFPSLPNYLRENLLMKRCDITFDNGQGWHLKYIEEFALS